MVQQAWSGVGPSQPAISTRPNSTHRSVQEVLSGLLKKHGGVAALELSPVMFRFVWLVVVGAHSLCAAFLVGSASVYLYLTDSVMAYYVQLWSPKRGNEYYTFYAVVFALVGALHGFRILQLIYRSIQKRRLAFRKHIVKSTNSILTIRSKRLQSTMPNGEIEAKLAAQRYRQSVSQICLVGRQAWGSFQGLFGVEGRHFLTMFVVGEIVELATRTYQAYRSSRFMPRVWLNTLLVVLLVANCWATLAVHHFIRNKPAFERVVALFADAFICIAMVVVVPTLVFTPYLAIFDTVHHRFNSTVSFYDPTFMAILVLEGQLAFASNFFDFISKLIPHVAIYLSLINVGALVTRRSNAVAAVATPWMKESSPVETFATSQDAKAPAEVKVTTTIKKDETELWAKKLTKTIFCLWGIVVLVLHLYAMIISQSSDIHGCRAATRPWFMSHVSCSSLVINCHMHGVDSPPESIFNAIDSQALATLTLAHCPALHKPNSLPRFKNLMIFHVYNSTVVEWGNTNTTASNPSLMTMIISETTVLGDSAIGLMRPPSLATIQFSNTNLKTIPEYLPWSFHPMAVVAFDYNELTDFPASLMALQTYAISLKGNRLETVLELALMPPGQTIYGLELNENPLKELPDTLASPTNFFIRLDLQNTNISSLPLWTQTQVLGVIYMFGTPYCANTPVETLQKNVFCFPRPATDPGMQSPEQLFAPMYAYDRYQLFGKGI